ncbi:MAG: hypothetical protein AAF501_18715, partial [Pseudomonadota bacterium]
MLARQSSAQGRIVLPGDFLSRRSEVLDVFTTRTCILDSTSNHLAALDDSDPCILLSDRQIQTPVGRVTPMSAVVRRSSVMAACRDPSSLDEALEIGQDARHL